MNDEQRARLGQLQSPWCTGRYLIDLYGVDLDADVKLFGAFKAWVARFRRNAAAERPNHESRFNRHEFENFLQANSLVSMKWAAVDVGMDEASLRATLVSPIAPDRVKTTSSRDRERAHRPPTKSAITSARGGGRRGLRSSQPASFADEA